MSDFFATKSEVTRSRFQDLSPTTETFVTFPFGKDFRSVPTISSDKNEKLKSKKDSFVLLVLNIPQKDGSMEQTMQEFSYPVELQAVEDWCDLYDIWFYEIPSIPLGKDGWCEVLTHSPKSKALQTTDLKMKKVYLVCGLTFEEDEFYPEFDPTTFTGKVTARTESGSSDAIFNQNAPLGLSIEQQQFVLQFQTITECTYQTSFFYLSDNQFDIELALYQYYKKFSIIPYWAIPKSKSRMRSMLARMMRSRSTSAAVSEEFDLDDSIHIRNLSEPDLSVLLLVAAHEGQMERLRVLLSFPFINKMFVDEAGRHVFHFAALKGSVVVLNELLKLDKSIVEELINKPNFKGVTVMRTAVVRDFDDFVTMLTDHMVMNNIKLFEARDGERSSSLLWLAIYSDIGLKKFRTIPQLLRHDIRLKSTRNMPPAALAAMNNRLDVIKILAEKDPSVLYQVGGEDSMGVNSLIAPFHYSQIRSHENEYIPVFRYLLEKDVDLKYRDHDGKTVFDYAREKGCKKILHMLYRKRDNKPGDGGKGGKVDVSSNIEVVLQAIMDGDMELFKTYIQSIVDAKLLGQPIQPTNSTLLHFAVTYNQLDMIKVILELGKDQISDFCHQRDIFGRSPLFVARVQEREEAVKLIEKSCNIQDVKKERDVDGVSFMHIHPRRNILSRKLPLNEESKDNDEVLNMERYISWDMKGIGTTKDLFTFPKGVMDNKNAPTETILLKTLREFQHLRNVLPCIFLDEDQAYPSTVLPTHIQFEPDGKVTMDYDCNCPAKLEKKIIVRDVGVLRDELKMENMRLRGYLSRADNLVQLSHILTILHHLGIQHNNLRPWSVSLEQIDQTHSRRFESVTLLNFACDPIIQTQIDKMKNKDGDYFIPPYKKVRRTVEIDRFHTEFADDIYSFAQLCALGFFYKSLNPKRNHSLPAYVSESMIANLILEVLGQTAEQKKFNLSMKDFMHELVECMGRKIEEHQKKYEEEGTIGMMSEELMYWRQRFQVTSEKRNQVLYEYLFRDQLGDIHPSRFNKIVKKNLDSIMNRLKKQVDQFNIGILKKTTFVDDISTYLAQFIKEDDKKKKEKKKKKKKKSKFEKKKKEGGGEEEEEEDEGEDDDGKKKKKKRAIPPHSLMMLSSLIPHANKKGQNDIWFPILDILRMLSSLSEFQDVMAEDKSGMFSIVLRKIFESEVHKCGSLGGVVYLGRFLCNVLATRDGSDLLFQREFYPHLETIVISLLNHDKFLAKLSGASLLQSMSWSAHLYFHPKRDGLPFLELMKSCCMKVLFVNPLPRTFANDNIKRGHVEMMQRVIHSFYRLLKFCHDYKKFVRTNLERNGVNLLASLTMIELFFISNMEKEEEKVMYRQIIVSLGAMLLPASEWKKLKTRVFGQRRGCLHDPFQRGKLKFRQKIKMFRDGDKELEERKKNCNCQRCRLMKRLKEERRRNQNNQGGGGGGSGGGGNEISGPFNPYADRRT